MKTFLKRLPFMFIDPRYFLTIGLGFALLTWADYAMRHCSDYINLWPCLSFIGKTFLILFGIFIPGNIFIRIAYAWLWPSLKWIWGKLMGAVTL